MINKFHSGVERILKDPLARQVENYVEKKAENIDSIKDGIKLIEMIERADAAFEKMHIPIEKLLKIQREVFRKMVEELHWEPKLVAKIHGKDVPLNFPFDMGQALATEGDIAIMRNSPAHRNLPKILRNDTYAVDLLCPPGVAAYALADGGIDKNLTQLVDEERKPLASPANRDFRVYARDDMATPVITWCVRHLNEATQDTMKRTAVSRRVGWFRAGEFIGETGYSGFYADNPPRCHLHIAVYTEKKVGDKVVYQSWPIKLAE